MSQSPLYSFGEFLSTWRGWGVDDFGSVACEELVPAATRTVGADQDFVVRILLSLAGFTASENGG